MLNNYLQGQRKGHLLSWVETQTGGSNAAQWTMTCKIGGEVMGSATAGNKNVAKDKAAKQALEKLGAK